MPLQRSNRDQLSGHFFYVRRLAAAVTRYSVRMKHDDRKQRAALLATFVVFIIIAVVVTAIRYFKHEGQASDAAIVGNRDTGAVYARVDGVLYPAWNLTSARLVTGTPGIPKWVSGSEIAKFPTGPKVGIPDAPWDMPVNDAPSSAWAACDTAASDRAGGGEGSVTAIAGHLTRGGRADVLASGRAVLASHDGATYVVWSGKRTQVDIGNRALTVNLGLDPGAIQPMPISTALFDAMPATEPLVVPAIPDAGTPSAYPALHGAPVGSVIDVRDAGGDHDRFYAVLTGGIQPITDFTANLLRTANSFGDATTRMMSPDKLVNIPEVNVLNVGFYPTARLTFIDTTANPVLCVGWEKARTDRQATVTLYSGKGLPIPSGTWPVKLVRDDRGPASVEATHTVVLPDAANFVASTSAVPTSETREVLWWVSPQGLRYGIASDPDTLRALSFGNSPNAKDILKSAMLQAQQAPWTLLRMFGQGPVISKDRAMLGRDTVSGGAQLAPLPNPPA